MTRPTLYVFDFDGTLTHCDTFPLFAYRVVGRWHWWLTLLRFLPQLAGMKLHMVDNSRLKERVMTRLFGGRSEEEMAAHCRALAETSDTLWRPGAVQLLNRLSHEGQKVVVVSASLGCWVRPIVHRRYPQASVIATEHATDEKGQWTGTFRTPNCYGAEKVKRLKEAFPERDKYHVVAYGDSRGDRQLLAYADEAHYRTL